MRKLIKAAGFGLLGISTRPRLILRGLSAGYGIRLSPCEHLSYLLGTAEPHLQGSSVNSLTRETWSTISAQISDTSRFR